MPCKDGLAAARKEKATAAKETRLEPTGELDGGYDVAMARSRALEHARRELPARVSWLRGLSLVWEVERARYDEDGSCYEVVVSCYPEVAQVESKGSWTYHLDYQGNPMAGTPVLRSALRYIRRPVATPEGQQPLATKNPSVLDVLKKFKMGC